MQHRTLRVEGVETHFLEAGEGPDLVLLHGGEYGASAEATWGPAMARLAERFRVVAPGHWEALSAARLRPPGYRRGNAADEFVQRLSSVETPLLILSCDHDPLNQPDWDQRLRRIVPGSRVHRFRRSAHEPQIEELDEFVEVVARFLLA